MRGTGLGTGCGACLDPDLWKWQIAPCWPASRADLGWPAALTSG